MAIENTPEVAISATPAGEGWCFKCCVAFPAERAHDVARSRERFVRGWGQMSFLSGETATHFLIAFAVVGLGLVAYAGVLKFLRDRPIGSLMTMPARERTRRLMVIDAAVVDARRRVVLIRRDNVEHLVLIGGPTDVVIESRIGAETPPAAPPAVQQRVDNAPAPVPPTVNRQARPATRSQLAVQPEDSWPGAEPSAPSEENNFTYGPNAVLDARDYDEQPEARYRRTPPQRQAQPTKSSSAVEADADSIIDMLRSHILNEASETAAMQASRQADLSRRQRDVSSFERMLNERMQQINERAAETKARSAQPARTAPAAPSQLGVGPATAHASAAAAQPAVPYREPAPVTERPKTDVALELEVARILEELQRRRKQKQGL